MAMLPADIAGLEARRSAIIAILNSGQAPTAQTLDRIGISVDGEGENIDGYVDRLYRELDSITKLIGALGGATRTGGGFVKSRARSY